LNKLSQHIDQCGSKTLGLCLNDEDSSGEQVRPL